MGFVDSMRAALDTLSPAERRVAVVVTDDPQAVAFGTMAELVARSETGAGTIARLCSKLGFDGFSALQKAIQADLVDRLRPAALRIREEPPTDDLVARVEAAELKNLTDTFGGVDRAVFDAATTLLSNPDRHVVVVASDACVGVGLQFVKELALMRANVELLDGNPVTVGRRLALADDTDVVVAVDFRRYDKWVVDAVEHFARSNAQIIALSDNPLSPLAAKSALSLVMHADAPGPFDSLVATLALLEAMSAGVAAKLRGTAADRLAKVEAAWTASDAIYK